jgi:hypothetical protein
MIQTQIKNNDSSPLDDFKEDWLDRNTLATHGEGNIARF